MERQHASPPSFGWCQTGSPTGSVDGARIAEAAHAPQRAEVVIERPVLLHQDDDVLDVRRWSRSRCGGNGQRLLDARGTSLAADAPAALARRRKSRRFDQQVIGRPEALQCERHVAQEGPPVSARSTAPPPTVCRTSRLRASGLPTSCRMTCANDGRIATHRAAPRLIVIDGGRSRGRGADIATQPSDSAVGR